MDPERRLLLLGDHPGVWRESMASTLEASGLKVTQTDDGEEILQALKALPEGGTSVIIGQELQKIGGLEAIFQAKAALLKALKLTKAGSSNSLAFLVTEAKTDAEYFDLLRARGITQYLYREQPISSSALAVSNLLFRTARSAPRNYLHCKAMVAFDGGQSGGELEDLSLGGAQVTLSARTLKVRPALQQRVQLQFSALGVEVEVRCEVRRLSHRKTFFSEVLILGLKFEPDPKARAALTELVQRLDSPSSFAFSPM